MEPLPWPNVLECIGHPYTKEFVTCRQCNGEHRHVWATLMADRTDGTGFGHLSTRCTECGGRKCLLVECTERRYHQGPHGTIEGIYLPVAPPAERKL